MANLFIVFTPFQLFVAQQIVKQERLGNNILIEGYVGSNSHFYDIYNLMIMDGYWDKIIEFPDIVSWDGLRTASLKDVQKAYSNYKKLKKILVDNNIDVIYISEFQNQTMRFTDVLFSHQGYKVVFFEEGSAHYVNRAYQPNNSLKTSIKIFLRDFLYYLPIYHVRFAKWRYNVNKTYEKLPIYKRYNILPLHHESYDVDLKISDVTSDRLMAYMKSEIDETEANRVLFMTDPMAELIHGKNMYIYFDTIKSFLSQIPPGTIVYIKYHPRDPEKRRKKTETIIKDLGIKYKILSKDINIPVEYYLQNFKFNSIYIFNASTYFYNGYVFPHCHFVKMLPTIYDKCIENKVKNIGFLKNLVRAME